MHLGFIDIDPSIPFLSHASMLCMQSAILWYQFRPSVRPISILCLYECAYRHFLTIAY